jgi:hypothetical protein
VIRDHLSDLEDRFFAPVLLGSGLLFLALSFVGAALAGGMLISYAIKKNLLIISGLYFYSRAAMYNTIKIYAIRMNGSVHDLPGHFLAAHRLNAPHLGSVELSARTNIALEHQFFNVGDDCLPGLGAGGQGLYPDLESPQPASVGCKRDLRPGNSGRAIPARPELPQVPYAKSSYEKSYSL